MPSVKAVSENCEGMSHIHEKVFSDNLQETHHKTRENQPQHYALTEASLVLVSSDADFATFWMMGAMFVGPYSCSLGRQLW